MADQLSIASLDFAAKKKRPVGEMSTVVPWNMLEALIEPHYP